MNVSSVSGLKKKSLLDIVDQILADLNNRGINAVFIHEFLRIRQYYRIAVVLYAS